MDSADAEDVKNEGKRAARLIAASTNDEAEQPARPPAGAVEPGSGTADRRPVAVPARDARVPLRDIVPHRYG